MSNHKGRMDNHMIALVKNSVTNDQLRQLVRWVEGRGLAAHVSRGSDVTIVGLVGDTAKVDPLLLESMDIIERVQRVSEPFKLASRSFHPEDTIVDCGHGVTVGGGSFHVIAGPCAIEGDDIMDVARAVRMAGATMLRGGACGTSASDPHSSQAANVRGLDLLLEAGDELDMPIVSEVADVRDVGRLVDRGVDIIQVGAHDFQNLPLLRELGKTAMPVLLKRGVAATIDEFLMAAEHVMSEGNGKIILCECGIRTFETRTRGTFDVSAIPVLHHLTHLPVIGDPSHAAGHRRYVRDAAYAATAAGADGLEIEVQAMPSRDVTEGAQALSPSQFADAMRRIALIRDAITAPVGEV